MQHFLPINFLFFFFTRYKGVAICFNILSRCLGGKYINFGVFWLYQDKAIEDAFNMMFRFMLNTPLDDIMVTQTVVSQIKERKKKTKIEK
jgi:hypothetical protein